MGASVLATRGHCTSSFTCPTDSGKCPFIPERILEVSRGKHLKEKAVFTFRKQKVDNFFQLLWDRKCFEWQHLKINNTEVFKYVSCFIFGWYTGQFAELFRPWKGVLIKYATANLMSAATSSNALLRLAYEMPPKPYMLGHGYKLVGAGS